MCCDKTFRQTKSSSWINPIGTQKVRERIKALAAKGVIRYFRQETPNLPTPRNCVLRETVCDIVIFIDDDVELAPGFVAAHAANFQEESVWAVCGGITERDIAVRPIVQRTWAKVLDYRKFDPRWNIRIEDFGSLKGCKHAVRRSAVLALGAYDEGYTGVALREESDLAMRILRGGRIVFDPTGLRQVFPDRFKNQGLKKGLTL